MRSNRRDMIEKIMQEFSHISNMIRMDTINSFNDLNKDLEDFFIYILNKAFNLNLKDLNRNKQNYPGIDLGDFDKKIAIQVTSQDRASKKRETYRHYQDNDDFDSLYIFILKMDGNLNNITIDGENPKDIYLFDLSSLMSEIKKLDTNTIEEIKEYIQNNLLKNKIESNKFTTGSEINLSEKDLEGLIFDSRFFLGGDDDETEINNIVDTYNLLFNKIKKLSQDARNLLYYSIVNSENDNDNDYHNTYYIGCDTLRNRFGIEAKNYINELIESDLAFYDDDYFYEKFEMNQKALGIYFGGKLEEGNSLAYLENYLDDSIKFQDIILKLKLPLL